jgi:hypothetical protein
MSRDFLVFSTSTSNARANVQRGSRANSNGKRSMRATACSTVPISRRIPGTRARSFVESFMDLCAKGARLSNIHAGQTVPFDRLLRWLRRTDRAASAQRGAAGHKGQSAVVRRGRRRASNDDASQVSYCRLGR